MEEMFRGSGIPEVHSADLGDDALPSGNTETPWSEAVSHKASQKYSCEARHTVYLQDIREQFMRAKLFGKLSNSVQILKYVTPVI